MDHSTSNSNSDTGKMSEIIDDDIVPAPNPSETKISTPSTHSSHSQWRKREWPSRKCPQEYRGEILHHNLHGVGEYTWHRKKADVRYEGSIYANTLEGYGTVSYASGTTYEGLFRGNHRFGPGVVANGKTEDVGLWLGRSLIRLSRIVNASWVPRLAKTPQAKVKLIKFRKLVPVCNSGAKDVATNILQELNANEDVLNRSQNLYNNEIRNCQSHFFNAPLFDNAYYNLINCFIEVPLRMSELTDDNNPLEDQFDKENQQQLPPPNPHSIHSETNIIHFNEKYLLCETSNVFPPTINSNVRTKTVQISDLLAWNNGRVAIAIMQHCFRHRYEEHNLRYQVESIFGGERSHFALPGTYERTCVNFLRSCCATDEMILWRSLLNDEINPDLCDAGGNSGIFYAAANDQHANIVVLCNFGANLDASNDECLTPLALCLLRHLAASNHVKNWERAFLADALEDDDDVGSKCEWHPHLSLASLLTLDNLQERDMAISQSNPELSRNLMERLQSLRTRHASEEPESVHGPYHELCGVAEDQNYLLDTCLIVPPRGKRGKSPRSNKPKKLKDAQQKSRVSFFDDSAQSRFLSAEEKELFTQLSTIVETIKLLLKLGADPNCGQTPMAPILLATFTGNPTLLELLLSHNANPNAVTIPHQLTPLHILMSQKLTKELEDCVRLFVDYKADMNARASPVHWPQHKVLLKGKTDRDVLDEGKTPLHILAMRYDFKTDAEMLIPPLAIKMLEAGSSPRAKYLGHVPLSIAVLRGNLPLIRALLGTNRVNPNEQLEEEMGTPLSVLTLKRYFGTLTAQERRDVTGALIEGGASTLVNVQGQLNLLEFMEKEYTVPVTGKDNKKKKKQKKPKKAKKNPMEEAMKKIMLDATTGILNKQMQAQAVRFLHDFIEMDMYDDDVSVALAKLLQPPHAAQIAQRRIEQGLIRSTKRTPKIVATLMDFVNSNVGNKYQSDVLLKEFTYKRVGKRIKYPFPELDKDETKYAVCFYCGKRDGKKLQLCPKCNLVYFCSKECNRKSNADKTHQHQCKVLFYGTDMGSTDLLRNKMALVRRFREFLNDDDDLMDWTALKKREVAAKAAKDRKGRSDTDRSTRSRAGSRGGSRSGRASKSKGSLDEKDGSRKGRKRQRDGSDATERRKHKKGSRESTRGSKESSGRTKSRGRSKSTDVGGKKSKAGRRSRSDSKDSNGRSKSRKRSRSDQRGVKEKKEKGQKQGKSPRRGSKHSSERKKSRGRSRSVDAKGKKGGKGSRGASGENKRDAAKSKGQKVPGGKDATVGEKSRGFAVEESHRRDGLRAEQMGKVPFGDGGDGCALASMQGNIPHNIELLIRQLMAYFPDFDFTQLFLPFVCFRDGQLYYRFLPHRGLFIETYSHV